MANSFKSYTTALEKIGKKKARQEHADWQKARAEAERRDAEHRCKLAEYLRLKGEEE